MLYPVSFTHDTDNSYLVRSRDIPEALAVGYSEEEAIAEAVNGLESAFIIYMTERRHIPLPSKKLKGEHLVKLPFRVSLKIALFNAMLDKGLKKADLARELKWDQKQVDRLLSLTHSTKLEALEEALLAINEDIDIGITA
ncbi:type II toxin-antitoxin system HicB family antitoxin [Acinetobacter dispersus]|uniref:type II toxin-antitoxin system HicB family antitoxin n=1 Tax=Acinetobacter dispersus TaxID=70348 RepID=UPI00132E9DBE|nr:type II toxin-antitoxin system HicB family antitoxin [Acinetobacter dispersus]QHH99223.1 type II toxin-antitoxin system HicB family antitoxin [Acinetobacter dispersus]